ncbi:hypothetical protein CBS101457_005899 [Exobasidium rhododendri]|nr:hypothetical protein CBS101457_005899 [Exobasidium rhododendri]
MAKIPTIHRTPDVDRGVQYWQGVAPTVDGVLGGYGNGTLPIVDAQGSRTFLLQMLPRLSTNAPASANQAPELWLKKRIAERGGKGKSVSRALDCGAGVGRVSRDVLTRLCDIVHIVEPVESFLEEAKRQSSSWPAMQLPPSKSPFQARKIIHFHLSTLQTFDPAMPYTSSATSHSKLSKRAKLDPSANQNKALFQPTYSVADAGENDPDSEALATAVQSEPIKYDVIWCQWCLQHLSDKDLVSFLKKSKACLVEADSTISTKSQKKGAVLDGSGIIVVKENVLRDESDGTEKVWYDDEDHSITRTSNAYERVFAEAGLLVVKTQLQLGLPAELFPVRIWCLCRG